MDSTERVPAQSAIDSQKQIKSLMLPLNRMQRSTPADTLELVDLENRTMFGVLIDARFFQVKQLKSVRGSSEIVMNDLSNFDFATVGQQPIHPLKHESSQLVCSVVPLNCDNCVLITIQAPNRRYLIYDYLLGEVRKEILPLRGSTCFAVRCPKALNFDLEKHPEIIIFN